MGHPSPPGQRRSVAAVDVSAMLMALQRVLEDYPWTLGSPVVRRRVHVNRT